MNRITKYHKRVKITFVVAALLCSFLFLLIFNSGITSAQAIDYYVVKVGDQVVGTSNNKQKAEQALADARVMLSKEADSIVYVNTELSLEQEDRIFAVTDSKEALTESIYDYLEDKVNLEYSQAYMIVSGEYSIVVDSIDSVAAVLETLENSYDSSGKYSVGLESIEGGNFTGITYDIAKADDEKEIETIDVNTSHPADNDKTEDAGEDATESKDVVAESRKQVMANPDDEADNTDETHNLEAIGFTEDLEIHPVYVDSQVILTADEAINQLQEDGAEAIGVVTVEVINYDESYYADPIYEEDESMYQGETKVVTEAAPGLRNVTAKVNYVNGWESGREYLDEQIIEEAVPEVIHIGTKVAPTFVIPVDGTFTSGYGWRWGALHEGCDYACSYAAPIWASCGGTVITAGWNPYGYGNQVVIDHGNGITTRYAHMCQVACYVGQKVSQYEVIGYAGNTGYSFGVHCHFEIRQNDISTDPLGYLN